MIFLRFSEIFKLVKFISLMFDWVLFLPLISDRIHQRNFFPRLKFSLWEHLIVNSICYQIQGYSDVWVCFLSLSHFCSVVFFMEFVEFLVLQHKFIHNILIYPLIANRICSNHTSVRHNIGDLYSRFLFLYQFS